VALLQADLVPVRELKPAAKEPGKLRMEFVQRLLSFVGALPRLIGRALIRTYQLTFSALVGHHCRHLPTCSHYGDEALARYGLWAGGWMTLARLSRCHPFGTSGIDNVPAELPSGACWYLPWRYGRWSWKSRDEQS
jgi:putative membrane protein insertion efficiency factor